MGIPQLADLVLETANAPGTGAIILGGAPEGRQTFADAFPAGGQVFYYASDGQQTEWGIGTLVVGSPNTLARTKVLGNLFGTANALNFSSSITVWCEVPAQNAPAMDDTGLLPVSGNPDWSRDVALSAKAAEKRYATESWVGQEFVSGTAYMGPTDFRAIGVHILQNGHPIFAYADANNTMHFNSVALTDVGNTFTGAQTFTETQTFEGEVLVPDVDTFGGKDALNAKTAEGRYVKSVPTTGQTRITSLVENSDGRAVFGDGTNTPVLANLSDLPMSDPALKVQAFTAYVKFSNGTTNITFPRAFKTGTVPTVILPSTQEQSNKWSFLGILILPNGTLAITNTGVSIYGVGWGGDGTFANLMQNNFIPVIAIGEF